MRIKRMKTPPELETERASTMSELASARERLDLVNPVIEKFLDQLPSLSWIEAFG